MLSRSRRFSVETYIIGLILSTLDLLMVVPILSFVTQEYYLSMHWTVWVVSLHLAFFSFSLPVMDNWAASRGKMEVLWTALSLFVLGTVVAGLANEWVWFMSGRVFQAIGMGGMVPFLATHTRRKLCKLGKINRRLLLLAFALLLCVIPLWSSWLAHMLGFRAVFVLHILYALAVSLMAKKWKVVDQPSRSGVGVESIIFFGLIILFLMLAITSTDFAKGWSALLFREVLPLWIVAVGMVVPLLMVERQGRYPFFEPHLFANWRLWILYLHVTLQGFLWTTLTLLPYWFTQAYHLGEYGTGILLSLIATSAVLALPFIAALSQSVYLHRFSCFAFLLTSSVYLLMIWLNDFNYILLTVSLLGFILSFALADPVHHYMFQWVSPRRIRSGLMAAGMFRAAGGAIGLVAAARLFSFIDPLLPFGFMHREMGHLVTAIEIRVFTLFAGVSLLSFLLSILLEIKKVSHFSK
ncbi:MFS transporter [Thermoactinomyces sp. AMNI-1]|uniref:MFS transporter n=2 Tax=Thermoactinomyces mirandus TaxID=2756294 RepID=A0A7W2APP8_9BACL|nr:MFS transporter [Thermoactinomyces mirandus]